MTGEELRDLADTLADNQDITIIDKTKAIAMLEIAAHLADLNERFRKPVEFVNTIPNKVIGDL